MKQLIILGIVAFLSQTIYCQYQIGIVPRSSPDKGINQKIGLTEIEIKYGSPSVDSREIWGNLVPYEKVWRAGANNATTVEFSTDVNINSINIPAGKYALFIIPKKNKKWEVILNKEANQWGAFKYKAENDIIRIGIVPRRMEFFSEELSYEINNYGFDNGEIIFKWEHIQLALEFSTSYLKAFEKLIEDRAIKADQNIRWIVYLQGAEHLENNNLDIELAKKWIDKSEILMSNAIVWNEQYYPKQYIEGHLLWTKAKILAQLSKHSKAIKYAREMKSIAGKSTFYIKNKKEEKIDELIEMWLQKE